MSPSPMSPLVRSTLFAVVVAAACGDDGALYRAAPDLEVALAERAPFVAVLREDDPRMSGLDGANARPLPADPSKSFYLAIRRDQLEERWFLGANLEQLYPESARFENAFTSLGVHVVRFRLTPDRLYVLQADDRRTLSNGSDAPVILEAFPLVVGYPRFEAAAHARDYVLVDPSRGDNRFGVQSDRPQTFSGPVTTELAFVERFRRLPDGVAFRRVFTAYGTSGRFAELDNGPLFRVSGALTLSLRRYVEGEGFEPRDRPDKSLFFEAPTGWKTNEGRYVRRVARWNLRPDGPPVKWLIAGADVVAAQPGFAGYDVLGAIKRGIESWNAVLGRTVLVAEAAGQDDGPGDDDKNVFFVDANRLRSVAFADMRVNPNTGEIRGASVYFGSGWVAVAHALLAEGKRPEVYSRELEESLTKWTWGGLEGERACVYAAEPSLAASLLGPEATELSARPPKERVEGLIAAVAAHEIGHTLGLRHNFMGSLNQPSSSIMDYLPLAVAAALAGPRDYDRDALAWLYGSAKDLPAQPFCTDEQIDSVARCAPYDARANPLVDYVIPGYDDAWARWRAGQDASAAGADLATAVRSLARYVRTGEGQAAAAATALMAPFSSGSAPGQPDPIAVLVLDALFPPAQNGAPAPELPKELPKIDAVLTPIARGLGTLARNPTNAYSVRTRTRAIDGLRRLQSLVGLSELRALRADLAVMAAAAPSDAVTAELIARVDAAIAPYFDR